jgi:hypothetical protein
MFTFEYWRAKRYFFVWNRLRSFRRNNANYLLWWLDYFQNNKKKKKRQTKLISDNPGAGTKTNAKQNNDINKKRTIRLLAWMKNVCQAKMNSVYNYLFHIFFSQRCQGDSVSKSLPRSGVTPTHHNLLLPLFFILHEMCLCDERNVFLMNTIHWQLANPI